MPKSGVTSTNSALPRKNGSGFRCRMAWFAARNTLRLTAADRASPIQWFRFLDLWGTVESRFSTDAVGYAQLSFRNGQAHDVTSISAIALSGTVECRWNQSRR